MPGEDLRPVEKFRHIPAFRGRNLGFQILETLSSRDCFNEVTAKLESALSKHVWKADRREGGEETKKIQPFVILKRHAMLIVILRHSRL
eukprot:s336_g24.t2